MKTRYRLAKSMGRTERQRLVNLQVLGVISKDIGDQTRPLFQLNYGDIVRDLVLERRIIGPMIVHPGDQLALSGCLCPSKVRVQAISAFPSRGKLVCSAAFTPLEQQLSFFQSLPERFGYRGHFQFGQCLGHFWSPLRLSYPALTLQMCHRFEHRIEDLAVLKPAKAAADLGNHW